MGSLYSDQKDDRVKGVFTAVYDINNLVRKSFNKTPFDDQVVALLQNTKREKKVKRKKKKESETLAGHSLLVGTDGSIIFISEEQHFTEQNDFNIRKQGNNITNIYHKDDIVVTKINAGGSLDYMKVNYKRQTSGGRSPADGRLHSFSSFLVNSNVHIFVNAWRIKVEDSVTTAVNNLKTKNLALYNIQIDANGDMYHKEIVPVKRGNNIVVEIRRATLFKDRGFMTSGKSGKDRRFIKVVF